MYLETGGGVGREASEVYAWYLEYRIGYPVYVSRWAILVNLAISSLEYIDVHL